MSAATPKVTVLMPVYNGERYLRAAMASILTQSFTDFEFLIIDDGSTDASWELITACPDPRIRAVKNESNLLLAGVLDKGLRLARGEYVARMDCDDVSLPERLALQVEYLDAHPEVGVLGTGYIPIDGQDRPLEGAMLYPEGHHQLLWLMLFENPLAHPSAMLRREAALRAGGYDSDVIRGRERFSGEDYDLWRRMAGDCKLATLSQPLLLLRKHGGNVTLVHQLENEKNSAAIRRLFMASVLGADVREATIMDLWRREFPTPGAAADAAALVQALFKASRQRGGLNQADLAFMRQDAARRIFAIYRNVWNRRGSLGIALRSLLLDPLAPARASLRLLDRNTRRQAAAPAQQHKATG